VGATKALRVQEIVRDELLYAYLPPEARNAMTIQSYSSGGGYADGSYNRERDLFTWELGLLSAAGFPKSGRVLVAAAGGGREMVALAKRGYSVVGLEPSPALLRRAEEVVIDLPGASVHSATYADVVSLARGERGPLSDLDLSAKVVWFGWGSFTHLTEPAEHLEILQAVRKLWPEAPVVLSFFVRTPEHVDQNSPSFRLRRALRATLQRLGGATTPPGLQYWTYHGFLYSFERAELETLFQRAGYRTGVLLEEPFAHALLLPA
jgi:hypothetical protein